MDKDSKILGANMVDEPQEGTHKGSQGSREEVPNISTADWALAIKTKGFSNLLMDLTELAQEAINGE